MHVILATVLLALLALSACPKPQSGSEQTASSGSTTSAAWGNAPDFSFTTADGKTKRLSDYAGKPLVLNFWAAWCPPCKGEMPEFGEIYRAKAGQFELLSVAVDTNQDPLSYFKAQGFNWVFGQDQGGSALYNITVIPVTVFIDRQGNIVQRADGMMQKAAFESALAQII